MDVHILSSERHWPIKGVNLLFNFINQQIYTGACFVG